MKGFFMLDYVNFKIRENGKQNCFFTKWRTLKRRCLDKNDKNYKYYGGKGVKVAEEWMIFKNFWIDMYESYLKHCEEFGDKYNTQIDRIDGDGDYCKENCRWATMDENLANRIFSKGKNNIIYCKRGHLMEKTRKFYPNGIGFCSKCKKMTNHRYYINRYKNSFA